MGGGCVLVPYRIGEVAERANVPEDFVQRLIDLGALPGEEAGLGIPEVRRARLLHSWSAAGLSVETILALVDRRALSLAFLDTPWMETPERLDRSYRQLAADRGGAVAFLQAVHQALGFAPPEPGDRAGEDDATMLDIAELFRGAGGGDEATLRLLAVYADSLRRIAKAEADYYETNIERRHRATGLDERQLIELGSRLGNQILTLLDRARHQPRGGGAGEVRAGAAGADAAGDLLCRPDRLHPADRGTRGRGGGARRREAGLAGERHLPQPRGPAHPVVGGRRDVPLPRALHGRVGRTRHDRARPRSRPAPCPRGHPYRSGHLPGRGRVRKDREPGRQDRRLRTGRTSRGERGDCPAVQPP